MRSSGADARRIAIRRLAAQAGTIAAGLLATTRRNAAAGVPAADAFAKCAADADCQTGYCRDGACCRHKGGTGSAGGQRCSGSCAAALCD
ncbi:MAG TPA: hypothetical protein VFU81_11410 [Thermomicrobiales bacterium]|nr:hypothetical protein [Thermomicrobiales bacterium]